ncbi:unnamed protein product [Dracunculus medinensis]|uniref:cystathionine beta-synthase n=1 Tax=Dracunculus medinensis TaxID=318479 RepID=A0A158Q312_DRAME|nr:unnamed protein product [Dracunculus medinensis]
MASDFLDNRASRASSYSNGSILCNNKKTIKGTRNEFQTLRIFDGKPMKDILSAIGGTPLVKLNRIPQSFGIKCNIYAKLEYMSSGGSTKDRIAKRMVEIAEECGALKPGMTIIEPICANTGIGLALVAAVKGYNCIAIVPEKTSHDKITTLKALGATVVHVPNDSACDFMNFALKIQKEIKDSVILDQFSNIANPLAHYESTGAEILYALDNKVDAIVSVVNTGGSFSGIGRRIKEKCPNVKVGKLNYTGNDFIPISFGQEIIDEFIEVTDGESFRMARRLIREEGLLCGGSSGAAIIAAIKACEDMSEGQNCIVILHDTVRNYMTKFVSDDWMISKGFIKKIAKEAIRPKSEHHYGSSIDYPPKSRKVDYVWSTLNPEINTFPIPFKPWRGAPNRAAGETAQSLPNFHRPMLFKNALEAIGNTPLVKLNKISESMGIKCQVYVKCEYLNPAGSVKDRIALRMIEVAEQQGKLKPGMTIIEPTSGNTGLGLAMVSAIRGYRCIIVMPEKMSREKADIIQAFGAEVVRTPTEVSTDSPDSHFGVAMRLRDEIKGAIILDQFQNICNPLAHYENTAEEILYALDDHVDMYVAGTGTGGTLTGAAYKIKEICPNCIIVAADPEGSILANPLTSRPSLYEVEGIGDDFLPLTLDRNIVDIWAKTNDKDSFKMARRLIREEGILCGGSSGSNLCAALQNAKCLSEDQKCVVILPDGIRNYM